MRHLIHLFSTTTLLLLILSGCNSEPQVPEKPVIDPNLPALNINGHIADMNAIAFEWKAIENEKVIGFHVYRTSPEAKDEKLHRIATIENRYATHYLDNNVAPNTSYMYRFASFSENGSESRASETIRTATTPILPSVSYFQSIGNMPRTAKLLWRPHTNIKVNSYVLQRSTLEDPEWEEIALIKGRLSAEYIDLNLDDNRVYKYRLLSRTYDDLTSTPSDIVKVVTKPLPRMVESLQASNNLPKKIALTWQTSSEEDFDHYNIYRATSANGSYDYHVKLNANSFNDKVDKDGMSYFYKVTSVDKDALESPKGVAIQGTSLTQPATPAFLEASIRDNKAVLSWQSADNRVASYIIIKTTQVSFFNKNIEEIFNITDTKYVDVAIVPDTQYSYQIVSVDENSIRSNPSKAIELEFQE